VAPGVTVDYERNVATHTMLGKHGIEVVTIVGSKLDRLQGLFGTVRSGHDGLDLHCRTSSPLW
jgi:hypothetical protein